MERIYRSIIEQISRVYDQHEARAIAMNQDRKKKNGESNLGPTKQEIRFFQICNAQSDQLRALGEKMGQSRRPAENGEMKNYTNIVMDAARNVEQFKKRKVLNVKANKSLTRLSEGTNELTAKLTTSLAALEKGGGFCCGGGDQKKVFRNMMIEFREHASNWRFLADIEPKEMSESFIAEPFNQAEFVVIKQILARNWPEGNKIIEKEKIVEKIIEVKVPYETIKYVDNSKPNRLSVANQLVYGINREMNPCLGIQIYIDEADKNNNSNACNMLGQIYELGELLPKDYQKAMYYYKKSHDLKNPYGIYLYGRGFERGLLREQKKPTKDDFTTALKLYTISAQANSPDGCIELADIYERGHFDYPNELATVQKDLNKANHYYCKARDQGSLKAINNLAVMYLKNSTMDQNNPNNRIETEANVQENQKSAVALLEQATASGFPMAFFNLGVLYEKGEGVVKNHDQAKQLFYTGAVKGCNKCKISYAFHLMDQTAIYKESFEEQYHQAMKWLEEVTAKSDRQQDISKAYYYLALYHQYGLGTDKKPNKAVQLYEKSAYLQYVPAMNKLGNCYYSGFGVKTDKRIAIGYYKQAAEQGNDQALVNLGTAYYCGVSGILEKNYHLAYDYFQKAMKAGNTDAYVHLSQMYEKGIVVSRDQKLAHELLVMGALKKNQSAIYMLNERGEPINQQTAAKLDGQFFTEPRPIDQAEQVPYIKDLNKALSSKVSKLGKKYT